METLSSLFDAQVARHADRLAVATPGARVTYGDLAREAERLSAGVHSRLGPGPEPVALLMNQDASFMAAMLAIMRAGKIFAPLDPVNPPARLASMLSDLGARLLITDAPHRALATTVASTDVTVTDTGTLSGTTGADAPASVRPRPEDLAWVIYTSGSTGQPKGVAQDHGHAARMSRDYAQLAHITPDDRLTLLHPFHTWDIFGALTSGAGLFAFDLRQHGIAGVADWVNTEKLTLYRSFPTTFRRVLDALGTSRLASVRLVHLSGEPITPSDVALFNQHFGPGSELLVLFGSNEAGLITSYRIRHGTPAPSPIPVGHPLAGVDVDLCDDHTAPVPPGDTGEIAIRSPHLFPGYWRNPELTRAAFRGSDEAANRPTFYSGDMGWRRADGCLFYAGRKDFQVKVGGNRIELAEIEGALRAHPAVRDVVVTALQATAGDMRLVAYVALRDPGIRPRALREYLAAHLPEFMQPDRYIVLPALPITPNGKVDRKALPPPERVRPDLETPFQPPSTPLECRIAAVFAHALDLDRVGLHDEFIELGGNSLVAMRILAALARDPGVTIRPRQFFEAATVEGVSRLCAERAAAGEGER